jgi:hypothetical protein
VTSESFEYPERRNAFITVTNLENPHGPGSSSVISVGCTLNGDTENPTWKVHIPVSLATVVAEAVLRRADYGNEEEINLEGREQKSLYNSSLEDSL